ncbi:MAG: LCP family protein, partial [Leptolyngbyaceae cyanobacterium bins.59]|nr:LCP family protein [Leptolyngbyaceae cyanobacterium bins.59]
LVDLLGGVEVYVPKPMSYVDYTQKLKIDLAQGWQTLNGDQAEQFARFRHDAYGDIGRVQRQQVLLKALRERLSNPTVLPRIPEIVRLMWKYIDTNLSLEEMLALANLGLKLDQTNFRMVMLPGRFSQPGEYAASFWIMDETGRDRVLQKYFEVVPTDATSGVALAGNADIYQARIAVQNASTRPHAASEMANYLKNQGFSNVYVIEDWGDRQQRTQIIAQQGDLDAAKSLKQLLQQGQVEANSTGDLESDLTIRVGDDVKQLPQIKKRSL